MAGRRRHITATLGKALARRKVSATVQRAQRGRISAKVGHLRGEGKPRAQAVAMALHMAEEGRLGPRGGYRRAKR